METEMIAEESISPTHQVFNEGVSESLKMQMDAEKKISNNIMSIRLSPDGLIFKDSQSAHSNTTITEPLSYQYTTDRLSGVYCQGVQYFDLSAVQFINN